MLNDDITTEDVKKIMPKNGEVAYVVQPKLCDFHKQATEKEIIQRNLKGESATELRDKIPDAEYDFRTRMGFWANGCEAHWVEYRMHENLGIGKGQKLEAIRP